MENLILSQALEIDAIEISKMIGKEILRWCLDVAVFLAIFIFGVVTWALWTEEEKGEEVLKEEVWEVLKGKIRRGGDRGMLRGLD
jgi:hypothetical protein